MDNLIEAFGIICANCENLEYVHIPKILTFSTSVLILTGNLKKLKEIILYTDGYLNRRGYPNTGCCISMNAPQCKLIIYTKHVNCEYVISGGSYGCMAFPDLEDVTCPHFVDNVTVSEIIMPKCTYVHGSGYGRGVFVAVNGVKKVIFGSISYFSPSTTQWPFFGGSTSLCHFEIGKDTTASMNISSWCPSESFEKNSHSLVEDSFCQNNLEQFLYNFRTYIIDRLYDYTGGTKHTITLHSSVYNIVLGLDEEGYANTFHMPDEPSIDYVTSLNQKLTDINWGLAYV